MKIDIQTLRQTKGIGNKTLKRIIEQHNKNENTESFRGGYISSNKYKTNKDVNLWQGDCLELMSHIPDKSVDIVLTDPPYGIDYQSNWGRDGKKLKKIKGDVNLGEWFQIFADESFRILKDNTAFYCFTRYDVYPTMYQHLINAGFNVKNLLILQKGQKGGNGDLQAQYANDCEMLIYANKGRRKFNKTQLVKTDGRSGSGVFRTRLPNVWFDTTYNKFPVATVNVSQQNSEIIHPTEKNYQLMEWFLLISSNDSDVVIDPFMGSGSTGVAAKRIGRKFIGIEIDNKYFNVAKSRIDGV